MGTYRTVEQEDAAETHLAELLLPLGRLWLCLRTLSVEQSTEADPVDLRAMCIQHEAWAAVD